MDTKKLLELVYSGSILTTEQTKILFDSIFKGELDERQLAALLGAMKSRGEHPNEIAGAALSMREAALNPQLGTDDLFDTCGTGGDGKHSFNISSAVAIVLNSMGYNIAKHGNRSVSSLSGSADFYEKLGIPVSLGMDEARDYFKKNKFIFLFAPNYHPAMKYAVPVRKALATRTIFNFLGPLTNPAILKKQMIGVYNTFFLPLYSQAAKVLGYDTLTIYSSEDGMDEVSPYAPTRAVRISGTDEERMTFDPTPYITVEEADSIPSKLNAEGNAKLFIDTIEAKEVTPLVKFISLNTALALFTLEAEKEFSKCFEMAVEQFKGDKLRETIEKLQGAK
jgi:anthranilate phosphoribosyltransferase